MFNNFKILICVCVFVSAAAQVYNTIQVLQERFVQDINKKTTDRTLKIDYRIYWKDTFFKY